MRVQDHARCIHFAGPGAPCSAPRTPPEQPLCILWVNQARQATRATRLGTITCNFWLPRASRGLDIRA